VLQGRSGRVRKISPTPGFFYIMNLYSLSIGPLTLILTHQQQTVETIIVTNSRPCSTVMTAAIIAWGCCYCYSVTSIQAMFLLTIHLGNSLTCPAFSIVDRPSSVFFA
jgi:hypothetical protein